MKYIIISLIVLTCNCFVFATDLAYDWAEMSYHKGDIWTIRSYGSVIKASEHSDIYSNEIVVKWNIKKGRMNIICGSGSLCDSTDWYLIRLYDKDTLRIDFTAEIQANKVYSDKSLIVPKELIKDIAYMEIYTYDGWTPKYKAYCSYGYTMVGNDNDPFGYACVENEEVNDVETNDVETNDCPPSWKDSNGLCKSGWYSN